MAKTALITGITGQDGSYLAELLLDQGCRVCGVVRRASTENFQRIEHLRDRLDLYQADLLDQSSLAGVLAQVKPDEIYNLAAMSFVPTSWTHPVLTAEFTGVGVSDAHARDGEAAAPVIVQFLSEHLGFAHTGQERLTELIQDHREVHPDLETLFQRRCALRQPLKGVERLVEPDPGVRERRPRGRFTSRLPQIPHRLVPHLGPVGMMGEPLDMLAEAIPVECLDRVDDPCVQLTATLLQQTAVSHLVGKGVLKRVLGIRKEARLVEQLSVLQMC